MDAISLKQNSRVIDVQQTWQQDEDPGVKLASLPELFLVDYETKTYNKDSPEIFKFETE